MDTLQGFVTRLSILVIGVYFGMGCFMLGMISDSGTTLAVTCGAIAMIGSLSLVIGGIIGALIKRWIALVPGTVLVLTSLTPYLPPLAVVSILLIYCCFFQPRNIQNDKVDAVDVDGVPIVQVQAYKDESLMCDDLKKVLT
jgi:hypothetical protein